MNLFCSPKTVSTRKKRSRSSVTRQDSFSDTESVSSECSYKLRSRTPKSAALRKLVDFRENLELVGSTGPRASFRKTPRRILRSHSDSNILNDYEETESEMSEMDREEAMNEDFDASPPAAERTFTMVTPGVPSVSVILEESLETSGRQSMDKISPEVRRVSGRLSRSVASDPMVIIRPPPQASAKNEEPAVKKRRSFRDAVISPISVKGAANDASIQTEKTVYYEQAYIDFMAKNSCEQLKQKDNRIHELEAALDLKDEEIMSLMEKLKHADKDMATMRHDLKTVQQELRLEKEKCTMEKGWKKYF